MGWFQQTRITERLVLRALIAGFALVLCLLGAAGLVALRGTRAIETDATEVGREQLAIARLLNDVQAGQNSMAAILHQLAPGQDAPERDRVLRELDEADRSLSGLARSAAHTPEAPLWHELEQAVQAFSGGVRQAVQHHGKQLSADLTPLFDLHDRVVQVEQRLLAASEKRVEEAEARMAAESHELGERSRVLLGACFVLALLCAALTIAFAGTSMRKMERQASELSRVSWHMLQSQESLARRFSHELHDELGQSLAAVKANLSHSAVSDWPARRTDCLSLVDGAIANVRELSQLLHPVILDDFGLDAGLRWLVEGFAQRTGLATDFESTFRARLEPATETHLFRIAQEALTNVARHSGASRVSIRLEHVGDKVRMSIEDNGRGVRRPEGAGGEMSLGIIGMRARAQEIGGQIRFGSPATGSGLRIEVEAPMETAAEQDAEQQKAHIAG
jgi:signal transduction histidine kinase